MPEPGGPSASARVGREIFLISLAGGDGRLLGWALDRFARLLEDVFAAAGDVIYREGDPADAHYLVVSGEIVLSRAGAEPRRTGERSIVGALDTLLERPRARTATASVATHLLRIRSEDWWGLLEDRIEFSYRVIANSADAVYRLQGPAPCEEPPTGVAGFSAAPASLIARVLLLRAVPLFARARVQALTTLAGAAAEVEVAPGGVLFAREAMRGRLVVVASGQLIASPPEPSAPAACGPGAIVGGPSALTHGGEYEVRAPPTTGARALVLPVEEYFDAMEEHFSLVRSALRAITEARERLTGP